MGVEVKADGSGFELGVPKLLLERQMVSASLGGFFFRCEW